jgi:hypothetical protein
MCASGAIPRLPTGARVCLCPTWENSSKLFRTTARRAPKFSCMRRSEAVGEKERHKHVRELVDSLLGAVSEQDQIQLMLKEMERLS